jgi:hypothetical protein
LALSLQPSPQVGLRAALWRRPSELARPSTNAEAHQLLRWLGLDFDPRNVCVWRAFVAPLDQRGDGLGVTFGHYFHAPIWKVACPARDTKGASPVCTAAPVPDALDLAANPEMPADHTRPS